MSKIHELYGLQTERLEEALVAYAKTLELLRDLKADKLDIRSVKVSENGWEIVEVEE